MESKFIEKELVHRVYSDLFLVLVWREAEKEMSDQLASASVAGRGSFSDDVNAAAAEVQAIVEAKLAAIAAREAKVETVNSETVETVAVVKAICDNIRAKSIKGFGPACDAAIQQMVPKDTFFSKMCDKTAAMLIATAKKLKQDSQESRVHAAQLDAVKSVKRHYDLCVVALEKRAKCPCRGPFNFFGPMSCPVDEKGQSDCIFCQLMAEMDAKAKSALEEIQKMDYGAMMAPKELSPEGKGL